jgi:DNA sulfur modification protein DndD
VKLLELVLHDFRAYGGRHVFDLSPSTPNKPIILIGALNGGGKTTFLDALQLVLYGLRARCASRKDLSYKDYLLECIHRHSSPTDGASIELCFERGARGTRQQIRVHRNWRATSASVSEQLEVWVDGKFDRVLSEQWDEQIDDIAPHRISHLFFFDGEKIEALSEEGQSEELIRTAVHALLGLDVIDRLTSDLEILDRTARKTGSGSDAISRVSLEIRDERDRIQRAVAERTERAGEIRRLCDRERLAFASIEERFRAEGGDWAARRVELEEKQKSGRSEVERIREELRELAAGNLPLRSLRQQLVSVRESAGLEARAEEHRAFRGLLEERDRKVVRQLVGAGAAREFVSLLERELSTDLRDRSTRDDAPAITALNADVRSQLARLLDEDLDTSGGHAERLLGRLEAALEELVGIERRLQSVPEQARVEELARSVEQGRSQVAGLEGQLRQIEEDLAPLVREHEVLTNKYLNALEEEHDAVSGDDRIRRQRERMEQAREILGTFRSEVLRKNLHRIEAAVLECFQHLVRKSRLVSHLSINPSTFALTLTQTDGRVIPRRALSAGESQLLSVAMLWGLGRVSGIPLPIVIDTPLGRLDSKHRTNLVTHYFPCASHQVIILSTDEEVRENRLKDLQPSIARSYLLEYLEDEDRTSVREGYFWRT